MTDNWLLHFRNRAEAVAELANTAKNESIRQEYQRLHEKWRALIDAEEARVRRMEEQSRGRRQAGS